MLPYLFRVIGSDRCLTPADVDRADEPHPLVAPAWDVYKTHFGCFTGSTLDPQYHRLQHPATKTGTVKIAADETVLVVGTGPSLLAQIDTLKRERGCLRIFTSPRGADVLLAQGIIPDLVLIEHQTAIDAHHSARHLGDVREPVLGKCPLVAADWRTPRALLAGVSAAALFVPSSLPTWGLWPATAVAMALEAGASRVGLLGIDLGTTDVPDPAHAPLRALLELLAQLGSAATFDCGEDGARKRGWVTAAIPELSGAYVHTPIATDVYLAPNIDQRIRDARAGLAELAPVLQRAARLRTLASEARSSKRATWTPSLQAGIDEVMGWRQDPRVRLLLQECLGVSFLPRFWRIGVDTSLGEALWRPLLLATHELTSQAEALSTCVAAERAA
jgi:hypothetical protein